MDNYNQNDMDLHHEGIDNDLILGDEFVQMHTPETYLNTYVHTGTDNSNILSHPNPLAVCNDFHVSPVEIHHVKPHYVNGYYREDGTYVEGYYRSGESGLGYVRSNPDDTILNNLNYEK